MRASSPEGLYERDLWTKAGTPCLFETKVSERYRPIFVGQEQARLALDFYAGAKIIPSGS